MQPCIRQLERSDRQAYLTAFDSLSENTRYMRFASPKPRLTAAEVTYLVDVDHDMHEALVAYECSSGEPVAIGRYVREPGDPATAEVALTVLDAWQGRRIGRQLLAELTARAAERGVTLLRADVLRANARALALLGHAGWRAVEAEGLMVTLERPLSGARSGRGRSSAAPAIAAAGASSTAPIRP
jgi:GNAT superfamily N-acetyltransferase